MTIIRPGIDIHHSRPFPAQIPAWFKEIISYPLFALRGMSVWNCPWHRNPYNHQGFPTFSGIIWGIGRTDSGLYSTAITACQDERMGWRMVFSWCMSFIYSGFLHDLFVQSILRWWFQIFFMFTPTWGRFPFWLISLNGLKPPTRFSVEDDGDEDGENVFSCEAISALCIAPKVVFFWGGISLAIAGFPDWQHIMIIDLHIYLLNQIYVCTNIRYIIYRLGVVKNIDV